MMTDPLAYHITWTTYGTWLHGDESGWVEDGGGGIHPGDPKREEAARRSMKQEPIVLSTEQRILVEKTIQDHCAIRDWKLHALNVRTNHVHVVVTAGRAPEEVLCQFKAWTARKLSDHAGLTKNLAVKAGRRKWWTEHGSTKWINEDEYLQRAIQYVLLGQ